MTDEARSEEQIDGLLAQFESGKMSRRSLIKSVAALATLSLAGQAEAASPFARSGRNQFAGPIDQLAQLEPGHDEGRKILLERILNHTYSYNDPDNPADHKVTLHEDSKDGDIANASNEKPIVITTEYRHDLSTGDRVEIRSVQGNIAANGKWTIEVVGDAGSVQFKLLGSSGNGGYTASADTWRQINHVFTSGGEHRDWLFGTKGSDWEDNGLRQYEPSNSQSGPILDNPSGNVHNHNGKNVGGIDTNGQNMRIAVVNARKATDREVLGLFALEEGDRTDRTHDYDDLYGLVKLKLQWVCNHCSTDSVGATLSQLKQYTDEVEVSGTLAGGNTVAVKVKLQDVITKALETAIQRAQFETDLNGQLKGGGSGDEIGLHWKEIWNTLDTGGDFSFVTTHGNY